MTILKWLITLTNREPLTILPLSIENHGEYMYFRDFKEVHTLNPVELISPVVEVSGYGREPLEGDGVVVLLHHLRSHGHRGRLGGVLPGLVDEVQVAMHPGHLVEGEGVRARIV